MGNPIIITDKECTGKNEVFWEFFQCPGCKNDDLISSFSFCPHCGCKLEWNISEEFSIREEVTIKEGKLAGISGCVSHYNRKTGKVTIRIDTDNNITVDYSNIKRK